MRPYPRLRFGETFGLLPVGERLAQAKIAVFGDPHVPKTRVGLSSLAVLRPRLSLQMWFRRLRADRRVPISNLVNRTPTPPEDGWSVRFTQVRDFRGGALSYDSHNGTDFAVPVGTVVVAAADGVVSRVLNEFHRGGLKVFVDHGRGVVTSSNHLARALVAEGTRVRRGDPIALAGVSGIDNVLFFPWTVPHVHWNVFLDGRHTDPFAEVGSDEVSMWAGGEPLPPGAASVNEPYEPSGLDEPALRDCAASCRDPARRARLAAIPDPVVLAAELLSETTYFPTRYERRPPPYLESHPRRPVLSLPFREEDYVGAWLPPV